ncbi:MAG TPA: NADP-dependent oxidoreductase, partial [Planctomycetaceae bacterium]|nr:NADP-dependent oxidoreductase [Planctomycetaceae bacterium]
MTTKVKQVIQSQQVVLSSRPEGKPTSANFKISSEEITPIAEGEFLVKNQWMSVDPYMRGRMKERDSYVPP